MTITTDIFSSNAIHSNKLLPFREEEYSKFKHGSKSCARRFGIKLATDFISSPQFHHYLNEYGDKQIVVMSSPYSFIPTATFAMKDYFLAILNTELFRKGKLPAQELKIHRDYSYVADYSEMDAKERSRCISGDQFHIHREFLKDKYCIFMDDIRITGSHEHCIKELIKREGLGKITASILYMYFAIKVSEDIPASFENDLNRAYVKNLSHIYAMIFKGDFIFNTRNVKFILASHPGHFTYFLQSMKKGFIETLYRLSIGNNYNRLPEFQQNFQLINHMLNDTDLSDNNKPYHLRKLVEY